MSLGYAEDHRNYLLSDKNNILLQTFRKASGFLPIGEGVSSLLIDHPGNEFARPSPNCMEPSLDELVRLFAPVSVAEIEV
jgi:hypothetical protein